jgi:hypothetical protein
MSNPDLLNPEAGQSALSVPKLVAKTPELPTTITQVEKFYYCPAPAASFHRTDGKRLGFVNQIYRTNIKEDQDYLDKEIASGNTYLQVADQNQVANFRMKTDPKSFIREQVEAELRHELEAKIRRELQGDFAKQLEATRVNATRQEDQKNAENAVNSADANKIAGVDPVKSALEKLRTGNATVSIAPTQGQNFQSSIVSSDKSANVAQ